MLATLESSKAFFAIPDATNGCAELVVFEGQVIALNAAGKLSNGLMEDLLGPGGDNLLPILETAKGC